MCLPDVVGGAAYGVDTTRGNDEREESAMVTFLHTADWQIGMTRRWLAGEAQARFAAARIEAIRTLGVVALEQGCEFVVVCGDVFEANQLHGQTVRRALDALRSVPVPVYLLPGNHDPLDALSIYGSALFRQECPEHVHVLREAGPVSVRPGVEIVAAPWESKHPGDDLVARAVAQAGPADGTVRIVVGHGAVDVLDPGQDAASIALAPLEEQLADGRIHYVALGDRHSRTCVGGSGRVWYSGAPEVTDDREERPGDVLVVRVEDDRVEVTPHHVGTWDFRFVSRELGGAADVSALDAELTALPAKERTVVRLALRGTLGLADGARLERVLEGHGEVLAALHRWDRHTDLRVLADGTELRALGLGGFLASAADEIRGRAAEGPAEPGTAEPEQTGPEQTGTEQRPAGAVPVAPGTELGTWAAEDPLDWSFSADRADDPATAADALSLLYRFTTEPVR